MNYRNIWNQVRQLTPDRKILQSIGEIKGVVVTQGINPKTVTVRAWWKVWNFRYRKYSFRGKSYQVHDEGNDARLNDIVVIRSSHHLSTSKNYYLKLILSTAPRFDYWDRMKPQERAALKGRLYETTPESTTLVDGFRFKALKERLEAIRASGIYEDIPAIKK